MEKRSRNRHMTSRARELRRNMAVPERRLWQLLRDRRLAGIKFRRQHPVGPYVADYCCVALNLIVEVDGMSHDNRGPADAERTAFLESSGFQVLRMSNDDVLADPESVLMGIARACGIDIQQWQ